MLSVSISLGLLLLPTQNLSLTILQPRMVAEKQLGSANCKVVWHGLRCISDFTLQLLKFIVSLIFEISVQTFQFCTTIQIHNEM